MLNAGVCQAILRIILSTRQYIYFIADNLIQHNSSIYEQFFFVECVVPLAFGSHCSMALVLYMSNSSLWSV